MAAWLLLRRPAGMKNNRAFIRSETGQFQFLERRRGHRWNPCPMLDHLRRQATRFADCPVGGVVFELEREKFERESVEISEGRVTRAPIFAF